MASRDALVTLSIVAAVVVTSPLHEPLNNPNEGVRVFAARALVEHGTFAIDDVVRDWGFIDDKATKEGRLYSSKAPLMSLLGAGAYAVVRPATGPLSRPALTRLCRVAAAVPVALAALLLVWALGQRPTPHATPDKLDRGVDDDDNALASAVVVAGLVIGTGVLAGLHVFSGHALAALAPAAALAVWRCVRAPSLVVVAAVVGLLGAAATAEYPAALCLPLGWLVVRRAPNRRAALAVMFGSLVVVAAPTLAAHTAMFGAPWRTGYSFLESVHYRPLVEGGALLGIGLPRPSVLVTALFSPEVGLVFFSPFVALGVVGLVAAARAPALPDPADDVLVGVVDDRRLPAVRASDVLVIVGVVLGLLAFIAGFRGWRGGWSVGPRYISELCGVLGVFAVDGALALRRRRAGLTLLVALVAVSAVHSGLAGAFFPHLPDLLRAPVGELALPLIWRGFCPDSLPLLIGLPAELAGLVCAVVVIAPVAVVPLLFGRGGLAVVGLLAVVGAIGVNVVAVRPGSARALEVRRVTDTWRPAHGVPYAADLGDAPEATLAALDRVRTLTPPVSCHGKRPARRDVGPGARALREAIAVVDDAALVVVDDTLADHIGAAGGAALVVAAADLKRLKGLPCAGAVFVVTRAGDTPARVAGLRLISQRELPEGYVLEERAR